MSLFGEPAETPESEGERPWNRWVIIVLAALTVALALTVIAAKVFPRDPAPTRPPVGRPWNDLPSEEDIRQGRGLAANLAATQTDPAAWSHVTHVGVVQDIGFIKVNTESAAVVERVCKQARRFLYGPIGPKLRFVTISSQAGAPLRLTGKNDSCAVVKDKPLTP
jgi:hypothetical protein